MADVIGRYDLQHRLLYHQCVLGDNNIILENTNLIRGFYKGRKLTRLKVKDSRKLHMLQKISAPANHLDYLRD